MDASDRNSFGRTIAVINIRKDFIIYNIQNYEILKELSLLDRYTLIYTCDNIFTPSYKYIQFLSIKLSSQRGRAELEKQLQSSDWSIAKCSV